MPKRFIEPNWKELRKLDEKLQRAWFYLWDQCDNAGVYHYDADYLKLDLKLHESISINDLSKLPECEILPGERVLIKNFIAVNYTELKFNYNPHKPAWRDIEKNNLEMNLSFNQASMKLEEEDKDKDKGEEEDVFTRENFLNDLLRTFKKFNTQYADSPKHDLDPLVKIAMFLSKTNGIPYNPGNDQCKEKIFAEWGRMSEYISKENFYKDWSLKTIYNNIQTIHSKTRNGTSKSIKPNGGGLSGTAIIEPNKKFSGLR